MLSTIILTGCSSTPEEQPIITECTFPDAPDRIAPNWICGESVSDYMITGLGYSKHYNSLSLMYKISFHSAQSDLARQMQSRIAEEQIINNEALTNDEKDNELMKINSNSISKIKVNLRNTRKIATMVSPVGGIYTLVGIPETEIQYVQ